MNESFKYEMRPLSEMPPSRTIPGGRYDALKKAIATELQPGWALFVDHEKGSKASNDDVRKMQPRLAQVVGKLGCKTRSDFARMGVWVYKPEHLAAPLASSGLLATKLMNGARP